MNDKCVVAFDVSQPLREVSNCNNNFVILFAFEHVRPAAASHAAALLPGKPARPPGCSTPFYIVFWEKKEGLKGLTLSGGGGK